MMTKRLLISDTRIVELTEQAAIYFAAEKIALAVSSPDHELKLSDKTPWSEKPVRKLLLFLGGHDVSND